MKPNSQICMSMWGEQLLSSLGGFSEEVFRVFLFILDYMVLSKKCSEKKKVYKSIQVLPPALVFKSMSKIMMKVGDPGFDTRFQIQRMCLTSHFVALSNGLNFLASY